MKIAKERDASRILDKAQGALIGSALGDTVGLYTEFMTPEQANEAYPSGLFSLVEPLTEMYQDNHRSRFEERAWTDDTDHTILMIFSYLRKGTLSEEDFAKRLRTWCEQGLRCLDRLPMGLGRTVGRVVFDSSFLSSPSATAYSYWLKSSQSNPIAPNGSLMRTSPIGIICLSQTEETCFQEAMRMGGITHADPRCNVSVAIVSGLVRGLCREEVASVEDVDALVERAYSYVATHHTEHPLDRAEFERHAYAKTLNELVLCDRTMGYVYKCLGSALWCLRRVLTRQDTFRSAMEKLVMCAGDADTNGAVAGALMGALVGYQYLPVEWKDGMKDESWYRSKIEALCVVAGLVPGSYDNEADSDTLDDGGRGMLSEEEMKKREMAVMEKMLLADKARREKAEKPKNRGWKFW